jgi:hypothetical protein
MKKYLLIVLAFGLVLIASQVQASSSLGNDDVAKGKTAVADATYSPYSPSPYIAANAVDGDTETLWNGGDWSMHWLKVDLGQTYSLSRVDLYGQGSYGVTFNLYYSTIDQAWSDPWTDNTNWTFIAPGALSNNNPLASINFNSQETRYLKYEVSSNGDWVALQEIAAYPAAAPAVPLPASIILLGSGLAGLAGFKKKIKK